jgi:hypothetical protein
VSAARQFRTDFDVAGDHEVLETVGAVSPDIDFRRVFARTQRDDRFDSCTEHRVGHADDSRLRNRGIASSTSSTSRGATVWPRVLMMSSFRLMK